MLLFLLYDAECLPLTHVGVVIIMLAVNVDFLFFCFLLDLRRNKLFAARVKIERKIRLVGCDDSTGSASAHTGIKLICFFQFLKIILSHFM